jgi:ATP phosphoribosyltransferase
VFGQYQTPGSNSFPGFFFGQIFEDKQMNNANNRIRIAIQKSGRLRDESFRLLASCGIQVMPRKEELYCYSDNFPLDLLLVRDDDIPDLVAAGTCDFGIVGTNLLQERVLKSNNDSDGSIIIRYLAFALCRLSIAIPKNVTYKNINSIKNYRIATSYPNILRDYIQKKNLDIEMTILTGSVEIAPRLGIADGICDLVSTGATLAANNLQEVETVFESQAVLIKTTKAFSLEKSQTATLFLNRLEMDELEVCNDKNN